MYFCLSETSEMLLDTFLYMGLGPSLCLYVYMFVSVLIDMRGLHLINVYHFSLHMHLKRLKNSFRVLVVNI